MGRTLQRYKKLFDELKTKPPHRMYFLYGPEEYIKKEFLGELMARALGDENRAFNLDIFHGDDFDRDAFSDRISSFPLFTARRMVVLKKFEALATANKDFVLEQVAGLSESLVFVAEASNEKLDTARMKKLDKLAGEAGLSFGFQYLSDDETVERVKGRLRREGLGIEPEALDLLIGSVGTHLSDLVNELEKIVLSVEGERSVDKETVSAVVGKYRTENLFSFLDHLGAPGVERVLRRMNKVIDSGEEPVFVMAMMIRRILQLMAIKYLLREEGARARAPRVVASRLAGHVSPFYAGRLIDQSERFELETLHGYLENLRWADVRLKSTALPPRSLLETSIVASHLRKTLALNAI